MPQPNVIRRVRLTYIYCWFPTLLGKMDQVINLRWIWDVFSSNIKNEMLCQNKARNCYLQALGMETQLSWLILVRSKQLWHFTWCRVCLATPTDAEDLSGTKSPSFWSCWSVILKHCTRNSACTDSPELICLAWVGLGSFPLERKLCLCW